MRLALKPATSGEISGMKEPPLCPDTWELLRSMRDNSTMSGDL